MSLYYHNPKCSKSRQGLEILKDKKIVITIKKYLEDGLKKDEIKYILSKLGLTPIDIIRTKEKVFLENDLGNKNLTDDQLIDEIVKNPILLERPILVHNDKAIIGRPPENLKKII